MGAEGCNECSKFSANGVKNILMKKKSKIKFNYSGVIPFRYLDGTLQILLITTKSGKKWITPKGNIEKNMTPQQSALKEAEEEAGIKGEILPSLSGKIWLMSYYF